MRYVLEGFIQAFRDFRTIGRERLLWVVMFLCLGLGIFLSWLEDAMSDWGWTCLMLMFFAACAYASDIIQAWRGSDSDGG